MKKFIFFLLVGLSFHLSAQTCVDAGPDVTFCAGPVTLTATATQNCPNFATSNTYTGAFIPYSPDPVGGTAVFLSDDSQTGMINLGFIFCFFGNNYGSIFIGSNNWVGFVGGQTSTWVTTAIPNNAGGAPRGTIMGPWQDINPGLGGTVRYQVLGVAPFRRMVVSYTNVPMFSCTNQIYTSQIKIFETTNVIETHILNKPICNTWNSGRAVHGLHSPNGLTAFAVPGRNNTTWTTANEGYRWTPNGPPNYTVTWTVLPSNAVIGTCNTLPCTVNVNPISTTSYRVHISGSNCGTAQPYSFSDTVVVSAGTVSNNIINSSQTVCAGVLPSLLTGGTVNPPGATYNWLSSPNGITWTPTGGTQQNYQPPVVTGITYYRRLAANGACRDSGNVITIFLDDIQNNQITGDQTICENSAPGMLSGSNPIGAGPVYAYGWESSPDGLNWASTGTGSAFQPGPLSSSTYYRRIVNSNGCADTSNTILVTTVTLPPTPIIGNSQTICLGDIPAQLTGGIGNNILWEESTDGNTWQPATGGNSNFLYQPGSITSSTYYRQVILNTVCPNSISNVATIQVNIVPTVLITSATICLNDQGVLQAQGNPSGGSYLWSTGAITSSMSASPSNQTTYSVIYTLDGCSVTGTGTITVNPLPQVLINSPNLNICPGNVTFLTATPGYTYSWNTLPAETSQTLTAATSGSYQVVATDGNGCSASSNVLAVQVGTVPNIVFTTDSVSCEGVADGIAISQVTSGQPGYQYLWSTGSTSTSITGLFAGTYSLTVTDSWGCTSTEITQVYEPPLLVIAASGASPISCNGLSDGVAWVVPTGGTPGYSYVWTNGARIDTVRGLSAGTYRVTVSDINNCRISTTITVPNVNPLNLSITPTPVLCYGTSTGTAIAVPTGGTPPYTYSWSTGEITPAVIGLPQGAYFAEVIDSRGCRASQSVQITQPDSLIARGQGSNPSCFGYTDGQVITLVTGGTPGYTYIINGQSTGSVSGNLSAGDYTILVVDNNGCYDTANVRLIQRPPVTQPIIISDTVCTGGTGRVSVINGTGFIVNWYGMNGALLSTNSNTYTASPNGTSYYFVEFTDAYGCLSGRFPGYIMVRPDPLVNVLITPTQVSIPNAVVSFSATSAFPIQSWSWNYGDGIISNQQYGVHQYGLPGSYDITLTVVDSFGCRTINEYPLHVIVDNPVTIFMPNAFTPNGDGINDFFFVRLTNIQSMNIVIYDRWGNTVYQSSDMNFHWDGTNDSQVVPEGTYIYQITGVTMSGLPVQRTGSIVLVR